MKSFIFKQNNYLKWNNLYEKRVKINTRYFEEARVFYWISRLLSCRSMNVCISDIYLFMNHLWSMKHKSILLSNCSFYFCSFWCLLHMFVTLILLLLKANMKHFYFLKLFLFAHFNVLPWSQEVFLDLFCKVIEQEFIGWRNGSHWKK